MPSCRARILVTLGLALGGPGPAALAADADRPVTILSEAESVLALPFAGYCSRPTWDPYALPGQYRVAFDVTGVEGGVTGRIVILDSLSVIDDRITLGAWRVLPSSAELRRAAQESGPIDSARINVQQLAWGPRPECGFVFCSNGTPVRTSALLPWFGGPLALYSDRWSRWLARGSAEQDGPGSTLFDGRSEFRSPTVTPEGAVVFEFREDVREPSDLCAIYPPAPETARRFHNLTRTDELAESLPVVSPDGRMVAFLYESVDRAPELAVAELETKTSGRIYLRSARRVLTGTGSHAGLAPAWCPVPVPGGGGERRLLAFYRPHLTKTPGEIQVFDLCLALIDPQLNVVPLRRVHPDALVHTKVRGANPPGWSSDGRYLFFIARDGVADPLQVLRVPRSQAEFREPLAIWPLETGTILNKFVAVSPDNQLLAVMAAGSRAPDELRVGAHPHWLYLLLLKWSPVDDGPEGG